MSTIRRALVMAILCVCGGVIYMLPFLREVYYGPLQQALGFDHTQMGVVFSVFGAFALIGYFPGGWLADQASPRRLIAIAMLLTGLGGLYFASFPSYATCIAIHALWGASSSFVFWGALIKATRSWSGSASQGQGFGILEGGRGITEIVTSSVFLALFAWLGASGLALSTVVSLISAINLVLAVAAWLILQDAPSQKATPDDKLHLHQVVKVLKTREVWLIALVVMSAYSAYWGTFFFTPLASDIYLMGAVIGGAVGVGKMWLKPISALAGGLVADRLGISKTVLVLLVITTASIAGFAIIPPGPDMLYVMLTNVAVASIAVFALRGIYFALLGECRIPLAVTGTATGVISVIGFTPDIFMPLIGGVLLDAYPGADGYSYLFTFIAGIGMIGTIAALLIARGNRSRM